VTDLKEENYPRRPGARFGTADALVRGVVESCGYRVIKFDMEDMRMKNLFVRLWKEEEGQDLTEYGLLLVLIALVATVSMKTLGSAISDVFVNATNNLTSTS
jgi:pilus assembly protein Flp/PilA